MGDEVFYAEKTPCLIYIPCAVVFNTERIVWVKVNPDYDILFRLMDGLQPEAGRRYWIREHGAQVNIVVTGEELGQMAAEVKIALPMSHNVLTIAGEYVQ